MKIITIRERLDLPADGKTDSEALDDCERIIDNCVEQIRSEHGSDAILHLGRPEREIVDPFASDQTSYVQVTRSVGLADDVRISS